MSKSGLSSGRIKRLHQAAERAVESGEVAGAITVVHRRGDRLGHRGDAEDGVPLELAGFVLVLLAHHVDDRLAAAMD